MRRDNEAVVDAIAFVEAVKAGLAPRGGLGRRRKSVPTTTLIWREGDFLVVESPFLARRVPMKGRWSARLAVDAQRLWAVATNLPGNGPLTLRHVAGQLIVTLGGAIVTLPASPAPLV
jgi:hypothetical protein